MDAHLRSRVDGSGGENSSPRFEPISCCFIAETSSGLGRQNVFLTGCLPRHPFVCRPVSECIDSTVLNRRARQRKKRFCFCRDVIVRYAIHCSLAITIWKRNFKIKRSRSQVIASVDLDRKLCAELVEHFPIRLHQAHQKLCLEHAERTHVRACFGEAFELVRTRIG